MTAPALPPIEPDADAHRLVPEHIRRANLARFLDRMSADLGVDRDRLERWSAAILSRVAERIAA